MHIHIYTCKWTCLPAINQKSKLQYHQSPSIKKEKRKSTYSNLSVNLCTVLCLSRQLLKSDIDHSFKNGISHTPLSNATSEYKQEDHLKSFICYRWVTFGVNKKGILNNIFFNWGSNDKQKVIALFIFCLFQTRSAWEKMIHALMS